MINSFFSSFRERSRYIILKMNNLKAWYVSLQWYFVIYLIALNSNYKKYLSYCVEQ